MTRLVAVLAVAAVVASCSGESGSIIPAGRYSGSTADDRAIVVDAAPDEVRVNQRKARLLEPDTNTDFAVGGGRLEQRWKCRTAAAGRELRCTLRFLGRSETIELMRE
ncbi:MAG TPA: hypothetical protein VNE62_02580 [Actinomycetota bacterium]|nr:hypothetical protein [Actinomycetota bacterium]